MKGREIVKVLECCASEKEDCENCPVNNYCKDNSQEMIKEILDLINRLKAERNKYKIKAQNQKGHLAKLYKLTAGQLADLESLSMDLSSAIMEKDALLDMVEEQKAELAKKDTEIDILIRKKETLNDEISELQHKIASCNSVNAELKAEIERLNIRNKTLTAIIKNYDWKFAKAKSEAIKSFAERLKARIREYIFISELEFQCDEVDILVKEMVGGNNV